MKAYILTKEPEEIDRGNVICVPVKLSQEDAMIIYKRGQQSVFDALKEIDIDEVAEEWHQKRSDRWDYDTGPDALPTARFDKTFSQYLEKMKTRDFKIKKER